MRRNWRLRGLRFAIFGLAALAVCGWIVTGLWNWLMPEIFGAQPIGFWQALGLLLLGRLLFGGFRGWPDHRMQGRRVMMRRWAERWEKMTPEEREKFRAEMGRRCGRFEMPETQPTVET
jgi:hypothetical protein